MESPGHAEDGEVLAAASAFEQMQLGWMVGKEDKEYSKVVAHVRTRDIAYRSVPRLPH